MEFIRVLDVSFWPLTKDTRKPSKNRWDEDRRGARILNRGGHGEHGLSDRRAFGKRTEGDRTRKGLSIGERGLGGRTVRERGSVPERVSREGPGKSGWRSLRGSLRGILKGILNRTLKGS